jgi:thiol-disulfide isomerase/thioredoxin
MLFAMFPSSTVQDPKKDPPGLEKSKLRPREGTIKVGDPVPEITIADLDGKNPVTLSKLKGKPTVLIFGSCTWPPFRRSVGQIEELAKKFQKEATLLVVYVREAHPSDGWQVDSNIKDNIVFKDPTTIEERRQAAKDFKSLFKVTLPILVDTMDDRLESAFAAWPDRIYILDGEAKVAYKAKPGPFGFKVPEAEKALKEMLEKKWRPKR